MALLLGCGNSAEEPTKNTQKSISIERDTKGILIPINSDNVAMAGYDLTALVMTVQFDNGAIYEYYSVPAQLWRDFYNAQPHPWSQVGYPRLVLGGFSYKRIM